MKRRRAPDVWSGKVGDEELRVAFVDASVEQREVLDEQHVVFACDRLAREVGGSGQRRRAPVETKSTKFRVIIPQIRGGLRALERSTPRLFAAVACDLLEEV